MDNLVFELVKSFFVGCLDVAHNLKISFIQFSDSAELQILLEGSRFNEYDSTANPVPVAPSFLWIRDPICLFAFDVEDEDF